jgi:hypothetical protein
MTNRFTHIIFGNRKRGYVVDLDRHEIASVTMDAASAILHAARLNGENNHNAPTDSANNIDNVLHERGNTHGDWGEQSRRTQEMMRVLAQGSKWADIPDEMKEALHMIAHKLARIVTGDPLHVDHWIDISGYARLGEKHVLSVLDIHQKADL